MKRIVVVGLAALIVLGATSVSAQARPLERRGARVSVGRAGSMGEEREAAADSTRRSWLTEPQGIHRTWTRPSPGTRVTVQDTVFVAHPSRRGAMALLIAGGAGVLAGLVADESAITIVSAGVAGVGLYLLVR